jgi:hypothetical protein
MPYTQDDTQLILSMQRNIDALHGTKFGISTIGTPLKMMTITPRDKVN